MFSVVLQVHIHISTGHSPPILTLEWYHCLVNTKLAAWFVDSQKSLSQCINDGLDALKSVVAWTSTCWKTLIVHKVDVVGDFLKPLSTDPACYGRVVKSFT